MADWIAQATARPVGKLNAAAKKGGTLGKRARLAKTLASLHSRGAAKLYPKK